MVGCRGCLDAFQQRPASSQRPSQFVQCNTNPELETFSLMDCPAPQHCRVASTPHQIFPCTCKQVLDCNLQLHAPPDPAGLIDHSCEARVDTHHQAGAAAL